MPRKKSDLSVSAVLCFLPCVIWTVAGRPICILFSIRTCQTAFVNRGRNVRIFLFARACTRTSVRCTLSREREFPTIERMSESPRDRWNNSNSFALHCGVFFFRSIRERFFPLWRRAFFPPAACSSARVFWDETRLAAFFIQPNPPSLTQCTVSYHLLSSPYSAHPVEMYTNAGLNPPALPSSFPAFVPRDAATPLFPLSSLLELVLLLSSAHAFTLHRFPMAFSKRDSRR